MKKEFTMQIDEEIIKKFDVALTLKDENADVILTDFMKQYIIETFRNEADEMMSEVTEELVVGFDDRSDNSYGKASKKIPKWALKSHQINHRIMKTFFMMEDNGRSKKSSMEDLCNDLDGDVYVRDFNNNFNSMCTDAGNSHGKVFEIDSDGYVCLWNEVKCIAMMYKAEFLKENRHQIGLTDKIRQYIQKILIKSKAEGLVTTDIRSGNIHKEMGLENRMPSVCGAMETIEGFHEYEIVSDTPSGKSSTRIFRYKLKV